MSMLLTIINRDTTKSLAIEAQENNGPVYSEESIPPNSFKDITIWKGKILKLSEPES